ncbi:ATP-dependent zinc metalloprotease FTSH 12, chloroplastic [Selaginella moellendorffii]|uniref:ATP-dependent zinc metalloprotease FTSH 12, chloroplastic n=1 Tax=Selaginella moellendorffii TaxID=88036 RepID=UPI000D1C70E2|nr:ATP-dependent zinc metalloprotease FTSH 12, chloroplastic [Selaginella moellendorffii]XP_024524523.1 ATP-dependent zinc metalloprotease FTSH 12, chloroplastic [Selaginella moellendorffii]|eukprot:XP_024524522.1 ATP-dependent zinc metalloprotease FTSH 12, chloroplastic [Selaginella moellendorffii]
MQALGYGASHSRASPTFHLPAPVLGRPCGTDFVDRSFGSDVQRINAGSRSRFRARPSAQLSSDDQSVPEQSWNRRLRAALSRYYGNFVQDLETEAGVDVEKIKEVVTARYKELRENASHVFDRAASTAQDARGRLEVARNEGDELLEDFRLKVWPRIVAWHQWERWKKLDAQHIGALVLYLLLVIGSFRGLYVAATTPRLSKREAKELTEAYLEATIPEPTLENVHKLEKLQWRENMPGGVRVRKHLLQPDGSYRHDSSFVGEHAWDDEAAAAQELNESAEDTGTNEKLTWRERLTKLEDMLEKESIKEDTDALTSKYVVLLDSEEMAKDIAEKKEEPVIPPQYGRGFWAARRWWKYRPKMPYFDFFEKVERMEVQSAVFSQDRTRLFVTMKEGFPSEFVVDAPADPYLNDALQRFQVEVDTIPESGLRNILRAYAILLPCFFIALKLDNTIFNIRRNASEKIVDLIKMKSSSIVLPEQAEEAGFPSFDDVIVSHTVWRVVEEIGNYLSDPMRYYDKFCFIPRGILIHGPPGTGKTHIARAMARELQLPFIFASGSEFGDSEIPGPKKVFDLFFTARANAPSIVFIDEIDALAGKQVDEDPRRLKTFKQLIKELDGLEIDTEVHRFAPRQAFILICATNRRDDLHEAFLQRQRIDREIHVGLPKEAERLRIFKVHTAKYKLADDVDFEKVVYRTRGFSGADLKNFANEIFVYAKQKGRAYIQQSDLLDVLEKQLFEGIGMTVTQEQQKESELKVKPETKRLLAAHEAGHVLLAHLFPRFDWHAFTHLLPGGAESSLSVFYPSEDMLEYGGTIGYFEAQMIVAHGGRGAEILLLGDNITDGWTDDLEKISALARECAVHPENRNLGLLQVARKPLPPRPRPRPEELYPMTWNHPRSIVIPMTLEVSELVGREIQMFIDDTEKMAMKALQNNRHILERLARELELNIKMTGDEIKDIVHSMNPVLLPDIGGPPDFSKAVPIDPTPEEIRDGYYRDLDVYADRLHRC